MCIRKEKRREKAFRNTRVRVHNGALTVKHPECRGHESRNRFIVLFEGEKEARQGVITMERSHRSPHRGVGWSDVTVSFD